jgi:predicted nucleic acid-binding protein
MKQASRLLTLDSNILIAALKRDELYSQRCVEIIAEVPDAFVLAEPSIVYQEVCGTLARRVGTEAANQTKGHLDAMIHPMLLASCDKAFCVSAYPLCSRYSIYATDAVYLKVALDVDAILVSLDKEDFTDKVKSKTPSIEVYHVSEFPY